MTGVTEKKPPPEKNGFWSILGRTKAKSVEPIEKSDLTHDSASESSLSAPLDSVSSLKGRTSKTKAIEKLSLSPTSLSARVRLSKGTPRKPSTSAVKLVPRRSSKKGFVSSRSSSPTGSPVPEEASRVAILEGMVLSLRAQIVQKDNEHALQLSTLAASIKESVTLILEEKFAAQLSTLTSTVAALELAFLKPSMPRSLNSYADISSTTPPSPPKKFKSSMDVPMTDASQKSRAQSILDSVSQSQIEYSTRPAPALKPGVCIVHIYGYRHGKGTPLNVLGALLEVKYGFPRRNIINVSPVNNIITELSINSSSLEALKAALDVPNCPFTLSTTLDVRAPLSDSISVTQASEIFDRRMTRVINRLMSLKNSRFSYIAVCMQDYKDNGTRYWAPETRPTEIFMHHFIKPDLPSSTPLNPSDEPISSTDAVTPTQSDMDL